MLDKQYNAKDCEDKIYSQWLDSGYFNPDQLPTSHATSYAIMMPPPNVTGVLHLGHALENALMDIQARYQRMNGKKVLLLPGTDHAAVATQARVETHLKKQGMQNPRQELGREGLLKEIRAYAEQSKTTILKQIRKLGTSADWSRLAYTFDESRNVAVNAVFKKMFADGLIYRGYRVVNWSVQGQSTCSDDELVYVDQSAKLYTFKYTEDFPIPIASTRPETKLGDTAVAVHPEGKYKQYIGQKFTIEIGAAKPLTITIIADDGVDEHYGTGALGVTPAHSAIDFEMYQKNKSIGLIPVIGKDGRMTKQAGEHYSGLTVVAAREKFVDYLKQNHLLIQEEEIIHRVATSDRFGDVIEFMPMEQWFVNMNKSIPGKGQSLKDLMRNAVTSAGVQITPERFQGTYLHWIDHLRDWCISRQIWWGHRIPVWYREAEVVVSDIRPTGEGWKQDPDTLDTWFSSATWTFSTLGWPEQTKDFQTFHPTAWMQMGHEILFFWMARMIMMSMYLFDEAPFKQVYIHGILRDKTGKKFSKSLGNGIDPLDMIAKYGTDALRLSLIKGITPGNDTRFYEEKVEDGRNFVNKLWNVARFVLTQSQSSEVVKNHHNYFLADQWIQSKLAVLITNVNKNLADHQFSVAAESSYDFLWHDFADWYVEITKFQPNPKLTRKILETVLKLLHPFIPFVTEAIWQELYPGKLLMIETWPQADITKMHPDIQKQFADLQDIITQVRDLRAKYHIPYSTKITLAAKKITPNAKDIIEHLTKVIINEEVGVGKVKLFNDAYEFMIDLASVIDVPKYIQQLKQEIAELKTYIASLDRKLANPAFAERAPVELVKKTQQTQAEKANILLLKEQALRDFC